jgi:very-short-patch-repair endonuclease
MPIKNIVRGQKVSFEILARAKKLRQEMTPAEKMLWRELKGNRWEGLHFRRQQIVHGYFADFCCHQHELIIELDGGIHELQKEYDAEREEYLLALGFRIIRFENEEITGNLKGVLREIVKECRKAT